MALTKEDPANKDMRIISILAVLVNIRKGQNIELLLATAARSVNRKENRESQATPDKTYDGQHLEEPQIEISIKGLVIEHVFVWNAFKTAKPIRLPLWKRFRLFSGNCQFFSGAV